MMLLLPLIVAIATADIRPFSDLAEADCMSPYFTAHFGDIPLEARTRYLTDRHYWLGSVEPAMLRPGEAILAVDVTVLGTPEGVCRLDCSSWRCRYAVEVGCWHEREWPQDIGCSVNHLISDEHNYPDSDDYVRCIDGYRWCSVEAAHRLVNDDEGAAE